ncbi:MAG: hypothetical protein HY749_10360 [Gammaproteobacteria bacterium]|nr:hypothetical protein [Gammaproteobacteria bacterium]
MKSGALAATLFAVSPAAAAAPLLGADLELTCESALKHDFEGPDAAMCEWYVRPCEVCGIDKPPSGYCLPPQLTSRELAAVIVADLRTRAEARARPVKEAVQEILKSRYPCPR